jgi:hypothetical protein
VGLAVPEKVTGVKDVLVDEAGVNVVLIFGDKTVTEVPLGTLLNKLEFKVTF